VDSGEERDGTALGERKASQCMLPNSETKKGKEKGEINHSALKRIVKSEAEFAKKKKEKRKSLIPLATGSTHLWDLGGEERDNRTTREGSGQRNVCGVFLRKGRKEEPSLRRLDERRSQY